MLKRFVADLHIHTCLSPCGDLKMTPGAIVSSAVRAGLDIIAITDHNSSENVESVMRVAQGTDLTVIGGIEITTREEIHILALFEDLNRLKKAGDTITSHMPSIRYEPSKFGEQIVVNEHNEIIRFNDRLLIVATNMELKETINLIHKHKGTAIASHIDKESFSIISQIGFIPESLELDALEISPKIDIHYAKEEYKQYQNYPWIISSDAHFLDEIGRGRTIFYLEAPTLGEIHMAFKKINGRGVELI